MSSSRRAEIWTLSARERERRGRCVAGLRLVSPSSSSSSAAAVVERGPAGEWLYTFERATNSLNPSKKKEKEQGEEEGGDGKKKKPSSSSLQLPLLDDAGFVEGDICILGVDGAHPCVSRALVYALTPETATMALDGPLRVDLGSKQRVPVPGGEEDEEGGANRAGGGSGGVESEKKDASTSSTFDAGRWRIDKDEPMTTFVKQRQALVRLCAPRDATAARLRRLIVDLEPPSAPAPKKALLGSSSSAKRPSSSTSQLKENRSSAGSSPPVTPASAAAAAAAAAAASSKKKPRTQQRAETPKTGGGGLFSCPLASLPAAADPALARSAAVAASRILSMLNAEQSSAVSRALARPDYLCLLGMPGTGKTAVLAATAAALAASGVSSCSFSDFFFFSSSLSRSTRDKRGKKNSLFLFSPPRPFFHL